MVLGLAEGRELGVQKGYEIGAWMWPVHACASRQ